jgi:Ca2+-binding RTX toxin-like protein
MEQAFGRMKTAWIIGAVAVSVVITGGPALARAVPCAANGECIGGKKADTIQGPGNNVLDGKAGNDKLFSGGGSDVLGGPGNDTLTAVGAVESEGNSGGFNNLNGGPGNDKINAPAGLGYNAITGDSGNDVINARNGAPDTIDCGSGKDKVSFDPALDTIVNCEAQSS